MIIKKYSLDKKLIGGTSDKQKQDLLIESAKKTVSKLSDELDRKSEYSDLAGDYKFMEGVTSVDELKAVIKTPKFWANEWAISVLERVYKIKFIILANSEFNSSKPEQEDNPNVLQCGIADEKLMQQQSFNPKYYIIFDFKIGFIII